MKKIYLTLAVGFLLLPTILISQTVSISGQVTRHNGDPVPDIEVACDGTVTTDVDGNFEFIGVALNYMCDLTPSGNFDEFEDVTVLDAIEIQLNLVQQNNLNDYQILACDLTNSQSVSALDMIKVFDLALRKNNSIQNGWQFIDTDYDFSNPTSNPGLISINATDTISDVDFIAVKRGDPAISSDYMPAPADAPLPIFTISNESFQVGDNVEFEVSVEDFSNIIGFQQTFKWDPNVLGFLSAQGLSGIPINMNIEQVAQGLLPLLSPMSTIPQPNGAIVIKLNFTVLAEVPNPMEVLSFADDVTPRQVIWQNPNDQELFIVEAEYNNGEGVTGTVNAPSGLESFQIFPNPAENYLHVKALLRSTEDFEISIVNILGQKVYAEKFDQKELFLNIGFGEFPAGTYFLSLKTTDGIMTESFLKN